MTEPKLTPAAAQALAEATAEAMFSRDRAAQALGLKIVRVQPGKSLLTMTVRGDMVNGHHICHGGMIFSLADTAFAYACNSYNKNTVASACHIDFLAPAKEGETLEAEAVEQSAAGRTGVFGGSPLLGRRPCNASRIAVVFPMPGAPVSATTVTSPRGA